MACSRGVSSAVAFSRSLFEKTVSLCSSSSVVDVLANHNSSPTPLSTWAVIMSACAEHFHNSSSSRQKCSGMSLEDLKNCNRDMLNYEGRKMYDAVMRNPRHGMAKAVRKWLRNKEWSEDYFSNGVASFCNPQAVRKVAKTESLPEEYRQCSAPGVHSAFVDKHFYWDGTPIPCHHGRGLREARFKMPEDDKSIPSRAERIHAFDVSDMLCPRKSDGSLFEVRCSYAACRFWKLAYSGLLPPDIHEFMFQTEMCTTAMNKGNVVMEWKTLQENLDFVMENKFKGEIWPHLPIETIVHLVDAMDLSPASYDPYMDGLHRKPSTYDTKEEACPVTIEEVPIDEPGEFLKSGNLTALCGPPPPYVEEVVPSPSPSPPPKEESVDLPKYESPPSYAAAVKKTISHEKPIGRVLLPPVHSSSFSVVSYKFVPVLSIKVSFAQSPLQAVVIEPESLVSLSSVSVPSIVVTPAEDLFDEKDTGILEFELEEDVPVVVYPPMPACAKFVEEVEEEMFVESGPEFVPSYDECGMLLLSHLRRFQFPRPHRHNKIAGVLLGSMSLDHVRELLLSQEEVHAALVRCANALLLADLQNGCHESQMTSHLCSNVVAGPLLDDPAVCAAKQESQIPQVSLSWISMFIAFHGVSVPLFVSLPLYKKDLTVCGDVEKNPGPGDDGASSTLDTTTVEKDENITFVQERATVADSPSTSTAPDVSVSMAETPWSSMKQLLHKDVLLDELSWSTEDSGLKKSYALPDSVLRILDTDAFMTSFLKGFAFYRPTIRFRIILNGTRFHCGRLIAFLIPPLWDDDDGYYHEDVATNWPHVFLDASLSNSAILEVPFVHFLSYFPLIGGLLENDSSATLGRMQIRVWNKLGAATGSSQNLYLQVYVQFTQCELHQPVPRYDKFIETTGVVQGWQALALGFLGEAAWDLGGQFVQKLTGGLATGIGGRLAGLLFDKPLNPCPAINVVNRSAHPVCWGVGLDHSTRLALTPLSQTETKPAQLGGAPSDYDMRTLLGRLSRVAVVPWTTESSGVLKKFLVCPTFIPGNHVSSSTSATTYNPTMMAYISRAFIYWRGTIRFHFQVVATSFHSGRVAVVFDPTDDGMGKRSFKQKLNMNATVFDVQDNVHEFTVDCPFMSVRPWLRCDNFRTAFNFEGSEEDRSHLGSCVSGTVSLMVAIRLAAPENVSKTVDINVYMSAGEDFELSYVNPLHPLNVSDQKIPKSGTYSEYPFAYGNEGLPERPWPDLMPNLYWAYQIYIEGFQLYRWKKIHYDKEPATWFDQIKVFGAIIGTEYETMNYIYRLSFIKKEANDGTRLGEVIKNWPVYHCETPQPFVLADAHAGDEIDVGSATAVPMNPIKGKKSAEVAPFTVSENAMNLQTVLRRYYPLLVSYPLNVSSSFVLFSIPVTPTFCPRIRFNVQDRADIAPPIHHIAWFSRLYAYWRGSLRYQLNYGSESPDLYIWHVPQDCFDYRIQSGVSPVDVQRYMSFAGTLSLTHVQGSTNVEVPFASPYNQCLIDAHQRHADLRAQNGTLFIAIRAPTQMENSATRPVSFSLFLSTGDDFVLNYLKAPPNVFEPKEVFGAGCPSGTELPVLQGEALRNLGDQSHKIQQPRYSGFKKYDVEANTVIPPSKKMLYPNICRVPIVPKKEEKAGTSAFNSLAQCGDIEENPGPILSKVEQTAEEMTKFLQDSEGTRQLVNKTALQIQSLLEHTKDENLIAQLNSTLASIQRVAENIDGKVSKVDNVVEGASGAGSRYAIVAAEVLCVGASLHALRRCLEEPSLGNFISLGISVAGCVGIACCASIQKLITGLINWIMDLPKIRDEPGQAQALNDTATEFIQHHETTIISVVAVFGTVLYAYIFGVIPSWAKMKQALKSFFEEEEEVVKDAKKQKSARAQAAAGYEVPAESQAFPLDLRAAHFSVLGLTALEKVFNKIMDYIKRFIDWLVGADDPSVILQRNAAAYRDRVLHLIQEIDELDLQAEVLESLSDPMKHNRYYRLQDEVVALTRACVEEKLDPKVVSLISECRKRVSKLLKQVGECYVQPRKRYYPFVICIHGETGAGKSYSFPKFYTMVQEIAGLANYNMLYTKNMDDEYWSQYRQQPIVLWDEWFGNTEHDKKVSSFMQLISDQPVAVPMAAVDEKGMPFTSKVMILGTNCPYVNPTNCRDRLALWRRRNVMLKYRLRAGFTRERVAAAGRDAFPNMEHIECRFTDPVDAADDNNDENARWYDFNDLLAEIREMFRAHHERQLQELDGVEQDTVLPRGLVAEAEIIPVPGENVNEDELANQVLEMARQEGVNPLVLHEERLNEVAPAVAQGCEPNKFQKWLEGKFISFAFKSYDEDLEDLAGELAIMRIREMPLKNKAILWALAKKSSKSIWRKFKVKVKTMFDGFCNSLSTWYQNHPTFAKALGLVTLFVSVAGCIALFRDKPGHVSESAYDPSHSSALSRRVKALNEGAYESGPSRTVVKHVVEASHYDVPLNRVASKRVVVEGCEDPVALDYQKVISKHLVFVVQMAEGKSRQMRAFHVCGHLVLIPFHFFRGMEDGDKFAILKRDLTITVEFNIKNLRRYADADWVVYDAGVRLPLARHQQHYFISNKELGKVSSCPSALISLDSELNVLVRMSTSKEVISYKYEDPRYGDTYNQKGWKSHCATMAGDCGSVLLAFSKQLTGKILGIHVAGKQEKSEAFSVLVTQEQLKEVIAMFDKQIEPAAEVEGLDLTREVSECRILPKGEFSILGVMPNKRCLAQPIRTSFVKTPWFEDVAAVRKPPKLPAALHPFTLENGQRVSPLGLALAKYGVHTEPFPLRMERRIRPFLYSMFMSKLTAHTGKRIFSRSEAILGVEGLPFAERLNMKSAAGLPYQIENKRAPGKWHLFDEEGNVIDATLASRLQEREMMAKNMKQISSIWRDCLKDELRPFEKVKAGKTRLFTIAPTDFTILIRQYFMDFVIAFYSAASSDFFSAVGINPESFEWTSLYNYLQECGSKSVAGDFAKFDGTLPPEFIWLVCDVINLWYDDGEENASVRKVLFHEIIHTVQQVENCVYMSHKGNPSGNPLTVVINTIICYIYLLVAWIVICPECTLDDYSKFVRSKHYGDDFLAVVRKKPEFNFNNIRRVLGMFGIELTLDTKIEGPSEDYKDLDDCTFLKRGFRRDPDFGSTFVLPTMSLETMEAFFYYHREAPDVEEQLQENMRCALAFAAFHGESFYNSLLARWRKLMCSVGFTPVQICFDEQVDIFLYTCGVFSPFTPPPTPINSKLKRTIEGSEMDAFISKSNSRAARVIGAVLTAPIYYGLAMLGNSSRVSSHDRTDDRWAVAIPSGEGKSWLAEHHPSVFVDHDELLLATFEISFKKIMKDGLPWNHSKARQCDFPAEDRRILLVHHPDNTNRRMIGSFITPFPSFVRANVVMRLALKHPIKLPREKRNSLLLALAKELEPQLFM